MGRRGVVAVAAVGVAVAACVVAGVVVGKRVKSRRKWKRVMGVLRELEEGCETAVSRLRQVVDAMAVEMHAGLASEGGSKLKMLLTFVDNLPTGYIKTIPSSEILYVMSKIQNSSIIKNIDHTPLFVGACFYLFLCLFFHSVVI